MASTCETASTTSKACLPEVYTAEDLNRWADRFWDPIFESKGLVPDADDRKVARWLTSRALLLMAEEKPSLPFTGSDLARTIQRVSQDESMAGELLRFMEGAQA